MYIQRKIDNSNKIMNFVKFPYAVEGRRDGFRVALMDKRVIVMDNRVVYVYRKL